MTGAPLEVHLAGEEIGRLERDDRGRLTFTYLDSHRSAVGATPLSCSMPLAAARHRDRVVAPFLWGLLPDNDRVLERWGRDFQVSPTNAYALLSHVGADLPGAVQILTPLRRRVARSDHVDWLDEDDVAALLRRVRDDATAWLAPGADGRWSLAGAQAKIALLEKDGRWGRPSGRTPTNRILKPGTEGLPDADLNEHLCLAAARRLGLRAAATRVMRFGEERAIVVDRYDRVFDADGEIVRIHQEDLCQALAVHPVHKYQADGGPGPADIVAVLRDNVDGGRAEADVASFLDALIFNWIVAAPDAHAKNYSLLLHSRSVRLAPLYDIASALPYDEYHEPKVKLAMKVGTHYRVGSLGRSAWRPQPREVRVDDDGLLGRAVDLAERTPSAIADAAAALPDPPSPFVATMVELVSARASRCAAALG